jgi:tetratricopeptide (TPR) repeat protein
MNTRPWLFGLALLAVVLNGPPARAADSGAAREAYEAATAAFGLGHYAEAAEKYETAFSLRPDPALLYNAAQAYRLAGNRPRALELYRNYLRLYPDRQNADEARNHVAALTKALEDEKSAPRAVAGSPAPPEGAPPTSPPPISPIEPAAPPPPTPPPALSPGPQPSATLISEAPPPAHSSGGGGPRTWIWIAVGAAVVVGGIVALVVATRSDKFPDASFGTAAGN